MLLSVVSLLGSCVSATSLGAPALGLAGLELGDSEQVAIQKLGPPLHRSLAEFDYLPVKLEYRGLQVFLDEQGVGGAVSTDPGFCSPAGACPGMRYSRLAALYGSALVEEMRHDRAFGYVYGEGCWLAFERRGDVVSAIELACSP